MADEAVAVVGGKVLMADTLHGWALFSEDGHVQGIGAIHRTRREALGVLVADDLDPLKRKRKLSRWRKWGVTARKVIVTVEEASA